MSQPNILFLMCDQLRGDVLDPDHVCQTPNFDQLAEEGVRITRAYAPNPVCSPARASLMTGLLPHNHGVRHVTHTVDDDMGVLREEHPHWVQRLSGYRTGYFGKWHVERTEELDRFGWQTFSERHGPEFAKLVEDPAKIKAEADPAGWINKPEGYAPAFHYGVTDVPPERRQLGGVAHMAREFLDDALKSDDPWCCFVSVIEPHDPFVAGREAFSLYDVDSIELPPSINDNFENAPNIYRRSQAAWSELTERQHKEAAACYYASVTEIDWIFGRLIQQVRDAGQLDNTIVVLTSDHGEFLGAHGLYYKNIGAYEQAYSIPMILRGPGIAQGAVSDARVGLHDLYPTLLDLVSAEMIDVVDSRSFAPVLRDPAANQSDFTQGYAEYDGTRLTLTQRVVWDGDWKYVFNGFDYDELYHLASDPHEMHNLVDDPAHREKLDEMTRLFWQYVKATGDHALERAGYVPFRVQTLGPNA
jgi:arylsulfatase A-like enzyme